jgi:enoyl-CoA hydratase
MTDHVKLQTKNGTLWITLNRPDCGNLITMSMIRTLTETLQSIPDDIKIVVINAEGDEFCKGRDYSEAPEDAAKGKKPSALDIRTRMTAPIIDFYSTIKSASVPTVSVVQGAAAGFGCALACACDIVIAGDRARFSLPEMHERGLPPTLAMTALLDRVNLRTLVYLVFGTEQIGAAAALSAGLVSAVEPHQTLREKAIVFAAHVCSQPGDSIRAVKDYLKLAPQMQPTGRAALGSGLYAIVAGSR